MAADGTLELTHGVREPFIGGEGGLRVRRRVHRNRAGTSTSATDKAVAPNMVWGIDFQFDSTTDGRPFKVGNIIDEHTREVLGG